MGSTIADRTIADRIAQWRGQVMPPVSKSVPRRSLRAKFGSPLERLTIMKTDKVGSTAKVAPRSTYLPTETARMGNCEKSTKLASGRLLRSMSF
ncbi:hypothetical protein ACFX1T_038042 [Malus domestica]